MKRSLNQSGYIYINIKIKGCNDDSSQSDFMIIYVLATEQL